MRKQRLKASLNINGSTEKIEESINLLGKDCEKNALGDNTNSDLQRSEQLFHQRQWMHENMEYFRADLLAFHALI